MDIDKFRADVAAGKRPLRITTHAQIEATKDGLLLADLKYVFEKGRVIEEYPERKRMLLCAKPPEANLPIHIVVEDSETEGVIVTAYIPATSLWFGGVRRKRERKRK